MKPTRKIGLLAAAAAVAAGGAVVGGTQAAGADEMKDLVICNQTESGMVVETDGGRFQNAAMAGPGCASFRLPIGYGFTVRLATWSGEVRETRWWQPGQNMQIDITGPVDSAQYDTSYW